MTWSNFYRSERDKNVEGKDKVVAEENKSLSRKRQLAIKSIIFMNKIFRQLNNISIRVLVV